MSDADTIKALQREMQAMEVERLRLVAELEEVATALCRLVDTSLAPADGASPDEWNEWDAAFRHACIVSGRHRKSEPQT